MTGADGTYDYKAMAAGIVLAGGEGMGNLLPVVEKELLHYRILDAMMREGFFSSLVFQGGTSLRLCHGSPRYSEDLDFAGGTSFDMDTLKGLGSCISDSLSGMGDDVTVRVKEPRPDADGLTRRWRIAIRTAGQRKDLPSQTQAGGGIDSRVRAAASSRLGQLSDVPGLVGSDHPRCGKPHRDSCRQAALLCLRIAPAATRPVGHVLVGVERRRRFPTGDGACGIEII